MHVSVKRTKVRFASADAECVAWHYPGTNGACVIMAGGFAVTKEPATDQFASGSTTPGSPCSLSTTAVSVRAVASRAWSSRSRTSSPTGRPRSRSPRPCPASTRPGSRSGASRPRAGYVFDVAARNPQLAAAIAQTPHADGPAGLRNAASYQKPLAMLRFTGRGVLDALGGLIGRRPLLVPLVGPPGTVAMLSTPDAVKDGVGRSARTTGTRIGSRRSLPARRCALASTRRAGGRTESSPRCWCSCATRTRLLCPSPPSTPPSVLTAGSLSGCRAPTTSPSSADTSRRSRPSCPSCAGTCSRLTATARLQRQPALPRTEAAWI